MNARKMLSKNRRSDSNLFRDKKSDCDCTLKPLKDFSVLINYLSFFHPFKSKNLVIQQLNYSL